MENNNKENISRRDFFKKSAQKMLPILGVVALGGSNILSSCMRIESDVEGTPNTGGGGGGCSACKGACTNSCTKACGGGCKDGCTVASKNGTTCGASCLSKCTVDCMTTCGFNCKGTARA